MILPDINVLVYAVDATSRHHGLAKAWLDDVLSGSESVGFAWTTLLGFVRLATSPRAFGQPLTVEAAFQIVAAWLDQPPAVSVEPREGHAALVESLLTGVGTAGNLVNDAHLAALAIEYGGRVASADHDFLRFRGVALVNPLAAS